MKCKKSIMGLAALLILIFHFGISTTGNKLEMSIYKACYIGVDIFFMVSAYSLGKRKKIDYLPFIMNRVISIYLPFVFLTGVYVIYKGMSYDKFLQIAGGVSFFQKGGGSFLWFFIGIMLIYLIAPLLVWLKNKFGWKAFVGFIAFWMVLVGVLQFVFNYTVIFILINRLPIFFIGLYYEEIRKLKLGKLRLPIVLAGLVGGGYLLFTFGSLVRLVKPVVDLYYILDIVFVVSLVAACDMLSSVCKFKNYPLIFVGGFTLELYGLQMIFGYDIENAVLKSTKNGLLAFLVTVISLIAAAFVLSLIKKYFAKAVNLLIKKIKKEN